MDDIFRGDLVRLGGDNPATIAEAFTRWNRDSEYLRLLDDEPAQLHSVKGNQEWLEKEFETGDKLKFFFTIHTLDDDRMIGFTGLWIEDWNHRHAWVGIGLGEREYWGRGYGTDAMRLTVRYAFDELDLQRVSLSVFEYNPRAIRSYEKAGFEHEGRLRQTVLRDGRRWDLVLMGILREDWEKMKNMSDLPVWEGIGELK
jgi:RimJ/RimL family protein N-acetyltransferase